MLFRVSGGTINSISAGTATEDIGQHRRSNHGADCTRGGRAGAPFGFEDYDGRAGKGAPERDKPRIVLIDPRPLTRESVVNLLGTAAREFVVLPLSTAAEITDAATANAGLILLNVGFALISDGWVSEELRSWPHGRGGSR